MKNKKLGNFLAGCLSLLLVAAGGLSASCRGCRKAEEVPAEGTGASAQSADTLPQEPQPVAPPDSNLPPSAGAPVSAGEKREAASEKGGVQELAPGAVIPLQKEVAIDPDRLPPKVKHPERVYRTMKLLREFQKTFPEPPPAAPGASGGAEISGPKNEPVVDERKKPAPVKVITKGKKDPNK